MTQPGMSAFERNRELLRTVMRPGLQAVKLNVEADLRARRRGMRGLKGVEITDFDPMDAATAAQPHEAYRRFHASTARVFYNPRRKFFVLPGFEDVRAAARDGEAMSSGDGVTRLRMQMPVLATSDGALHAKLRKQALPGFTKGALESWQPAIDELATRLVGEVLADPGCDVVDRLTVPMPITLIASLLGVPDGDMAKFRKWSVDCTAAMELELTQRGFKQMLKTSVGISNLWRYFNDKFDDGTLLESGTILGRMLAEDEEKALDRLELFFIALLLLIAGNETTTNLLGGMFDTLGRDPEHFERLRADPSLINPAVEEQLRIATPIQLLFRSTTRDYPVGDVTIPTGSRVMLCFGAANRDPAVFDDPDTYRVDRKPAHLAFGYGMHMCLGAQLARLEARAVLHELVTRVELIEAVGRQRGRRPARCAGRSTCRFA